MYRGLLSFVATTPTKMRQTKEVSIKYFCIAQSIRIRFHQRLSVLLSSRSHSHYVQYSIVAIAITASVQPNTLQFIEAVVVVVQLSHDAQESQDDEISIGTMYLPLRRQPCH